MLSFVLNLFMESSEEFKFMDDSDTKRFQKAISQCRTCNHVMMAHSFRCNKKGICMDAVLRSNEQYTSCSCVSFIPKDNLEFLEWAAQNKEKK